MAVLTTDLLTVPPMWSIQRSRLGSLGRRLWPHLLAGWVPSWEWGLEDIVGGQQLTRLALNGGATLERDGLVCDAAGEGAGVTAPDHLKLSYTLGLVWIGYALGTVDVNSNIFGILANNTAASPFYGIGFFYDASSHVAVGFNTAGTFQNTAISTSIATTRQVVVVTLWKQASSTSGEIRYGTSGYANQGNFNVNTNPTYGATSLIQIGSDGARPTVKPNIVTQAAYIFRAHLSIAEIGELQVDPYAMVRPEKVQRTYRVNSTPSLGRSFVAGMIG